MADHRSGSPQAYPESLLCLADAVPVSADSVKAASQQIPDEFRLAVCLADVEGFCYEEIAKLMGPPAGTVMSRLHRAVANFVPYSRLMPMSADSPGISP